MYSSKQFYFSDDSVNDEYLPTFTQDLKNSILDDNTTSDSVAVRSFLINNNRLWTSGIVPYKIDPAFSK